jgi:hypothetical protein
MDAVAAQANFDKLSEGDRQRYALLLAECDRLRLGCRCVMVGGRDFTVIVGKGYATAKFWLEAFNLTP